MNDFKSYDVRHDDAVVESSIDIRSIILWVFELRYWMLAGAALGLFLGYIYIKSADKIYESTVQVELVPPSGKIQDILGDRYSSINEDKHYQTEVKKLTSPEVVEELLNKISKQFPKAADRLDTRSVKNSITVKPLRLTRLVDISYQDTNRELCQYAADQIVETYKIRSMAIRSSSYNVVVELFEGQVADFEKRILDLESKIFEYRSKFPTVDFDSSVTQDVRTIQLIDEQINTLLNDNARLTSEITAYGQYLNHGEKDEQTLIASVSAKGPLTEVLSQLNAEKLNFESIRRRYGPKHPTYSESFRLINDLNELVLAEAARLQLNLMKSLEVNKSTIDKLRENKISAQSVKLENEKALINYRQLESQLSILRVKYQQALDKLNEALSESSNNYGELFKIHDAIMPENPVKPRTSLIMLMGFVAGAGATTGLGFLVLRDKSQTVFNLDTVYSDKTLEPYLLGVHPKYSILDVERTCVANVFKTEKLAKQVSNNCRVACDLMLGGQSDKKIFVVSSSNPSEGKSFVSSSLAYSYAESGLKTLLLDLDLRNPTLSKYFNTTAKECITSFLTGRRSNVESLQKTSDNLWVICKSAKTKSVSSIMNHANISRLIALALENFDRVVIDTPPVNLVSDALMVATVAKNVILVAESDRTDKKTIIENIGKFKRSNLGNIGVILNKYVPKSTMFKGNYGSYYYYQYYYSKKYGNSYAYKDYQKYIE